MYQSSSNTYLILFYLIKFKDLSIALKIIYFFFSEYTLPPGRMYLSNGSYIS